MECPLVDEVKHVDQVPRQKTCNFCNKEFSKKSNLKRHQLNVHKRDEDGKLIEEILDENLVFICMTCNKTFASKYRLNYHTKAIHLSEDKYKCSFCEYSSILRTNVIRHENKVHDTKKNESKTWACSVCDSKFLKFKTLRTHERKKHNIYKEVYKDERKCPICSFVTTPVKKPGIYSHFENAHGIPMNWISCTFNSLADFYEWKLEMEKSTTSLYVKRFRGKKSATYRCHRSGQFKSSGKNKRKEKRSGSCKINAFCPAVIHVKSKDNGVEILYQSTHVGHINEVKHKKLSIEEKNAVKKQIAGEVPLEDDLNVVPVSIANDDLRLMYIAKKKDIHNIEQSINFDDELNKYPINPKNVQAWIDSMRSSSETALLMFKPHGVLYNNDLFISKDSFFLSFMTKAQKLLLQKYGCDTIILHHTRSSNIHMYSLLTLDECREAFPTAFMFTDKLDENSLTIFLEKVKFTVGDLEPMVFISCTENLSYSTWVKVMGIPKTRLFITSHVLEEWKYHLDQINVKNKGEKIYKMLEDLLYEFDIDNFMKSLKETLETLQNDVDTKLFLDYFEENFIKNEIYKCWAFCYCVNAAVNPNVSFNNFNYLLTLLKLKGENTKPLKLTLCTVISLLKDKLIHLMIKLKKKTFLENMRLLRFRHLESLKFETSNVKRHEDRWVVSIPKRKNAFVVKRVGTCMFCKQLMCTLCNVCFHEYVCTCKDYKIKQNMCKHIHLVARSLKNEDMSVATIENKVGLEFIDTESLFGDNIGSTTANTVGLNLVDNVNSIGEKNESIFDNKIGLEFEDNKNSIGIVNETIIENQVEIEFVDNDSSIGDKNGSIFDNKIGLEFEDTKNSMEIMDVSVIENEVELEYVDKDNLIGDNNGSNTNNVFVGDGDKTFEDLSTNIVEINDCNIEEDGTVIMNMDFANDQEIIIEELGIDNSIMQNKIKMINELEDLNTFLQENVVNNDQIDFVKKEIKYIMAAVGAMKSAM